MAMSKYRIDFKEVDRVALGCSLAILQRWLPDGYVHSNEYVALNPTRSDSKKGSFSINVINGKWADFATGDKGCGMIQLTSYLFKIPAKEAANKLCVMLGMEQPQ